MEFSYASVSESAQRLTVGYKVMMLRSPAASLGGEVETGQAAVEAWLPDVSLNGPYNGNFCPVAY